MIEAKSEIEPGDIIGGDVRAMVDGRQRTSLIEAGRSLVIWRARISRTMKSSSSRPDSRVIAGTFAALWSGGSPPTCPRVPCALGCRFPASLSAASSRANIGSQLTLKNSFAGRPRRSSLITARARRCLLAFSCWVRVSVVSSSMSFWVL